MNSIIMSDEFISLLQLINMNGVGIIKQQSNKRALFSFFIVAILVRQMSIFILKCIVAKNISLLNIKLCL